jgi:hypothetical protein
MVKPKARLSRSRPDKRSCSAQKNRKAKTPMAGSEIGRPPQSDVRNTDEYGLIIVTWQPELPVMSASARPGTNEQWIA